MPRDAVELPRPATTGGMPLVEALARRRSARQYGPGALDVAQLGQLLWAAQGITSEEGARTAPSAGALYPLEIHVAAGRVEGLDAAVYHYDPGAHRLVKVLGIDVRPMLAGAAHGQSWVREAPAVIACSAVFGRSTAKYGERGRRYAHMEVGHVAQNVLLAATALGLRGVVVGAFDDAEASEAFPSPRGCLTLCLLPVGPPAGG